ncbi:MAG: DUF4340 domain-containing protein [Phycisphaerae bacterium]
MNFKTTLLLAVVLAVLGGFYLVSKKAQPSQSAVAQVKPPLQPGTSAISLPVLDAKLADVVKIVCTPKGEPEAWVFEKNGEKTAAGQDSWSMVSPLAMTVMSWEVQRIATQLTNIKYDISYDSGEALSATDAGLDPPEAVITLTDEDGKSATLEIGRPVSPMETYIRVAGTDRICVGKGELASLIKPKPLDYRDQQVWRFTPGDTTRIEIDAPNAKPAHIVFAMHEGQWMLESPVSAKADQAKVDEMARTLSMLRVAKWVDHDPAHLSMYGVEPGFITVRATVETEVKNEEDTDGDEAVADDGGGGGGGGEHEEAEDKPAEPKIETSTYVLHISDQSPIGEETKVYVRAGDESMTGTMMKTLADRFVPAMSDWRDMKLSPVNATTASRVEIKTPTGVAKLRKTGRTWIFDDGAKADDASVRELLVAINALTAVKYVESDDTDVARFGLDTPQVEIRLTLRGVPDVERIAVGRYTDPNSKRMVFVRRNEVASIAKIRVGDAEELMRHPRSYRDRSIVNLDNARIEKLVITAPNPCAQDQSSISITKTAGRWTMSAPVQASLNDQDFKTLLDQITNLTAEAIVADAGELSAYGLHDPELVIAITHNPPKTVRLQEPKNDGDKNDDGEPNEMDSVEVQPPPETIQLLMTEHDGQVYAKRSDRPSIFQVSPEVFRRAAEELRSTVLLSPDKDTANGFAIRFGQTEYRFKKQDKHWIYEADPDLPLDDKKVDNLLLQIGDLRTIRYVSHTDVADLSAYGLSNPQIVVTITGSGTAPQTLMISAQTCPGDPMGGFYATVPGRPGVFLLTPDDKARLQVDLASLEQ